jgi:hypothetical protein
LNQNAILFNLKEEPEPKENLLTLRDMRISWLHIFTQL